MFDNTAGELTAQGEKFFIREAAETKTALSNVTGWWMCDSKSLASLGGVSKYGYNWNLNGHREGVSMVTNNLDPEKIKPALLNSCKSLADDILSRETEALREQWRQGRTAAFFAQHTADVKDSVQDTIKALSEWEAARPEPEV